jgi:hypothetical protein
LPLCMFHIKAECQPKGRKHQLTQTVCRSYIFIQFQICLLSNVTV